METETQGTPPTVNEIISTFLKKLDDIVVRLDRIERRQIQVKEELVEKVPEQGGFGKMEG
jgi:hypothetical protein